VRWEGGWVEDMEEKALMEEDAGVSLKKIISKALVKAADNRRLIENKRPEVAARVIEMMAEGKSWKSIMKQEGIDFYTLVSLKGRHGGLIDKRREFVARDALELIEAARLLQLEKMKMLSEDDGALRRTNIRDLAMSYGIYAEKFFLASEGNRMTIEHKHSAPSLEDAVKAINEAKLKIKQCEVVSSEVMGLNKAIEI
jgi:Lhr-like helicase